MRVVSHPRKLSKVKPPKPEAKPFLVSADRPPNSEDNPRHVVLIADDPTAMPRKVSVRNPGDREVNIEGAIYTHTHEDPEGKWVYTRTQSA